MAVLLSLLGLLGCGVQPQGAAWAPNGYSLPGTLSGGDASTLSGSDGSAKNDGANEGDSAGTADGQGADQALEIVDNSPDMDSDGYTVNGGDCDDFNTAVHPGAQEICNDQDDNCNGQVDDLDLDGDGFSQCPGNAQDCDDADAAIHPGAVVACEPEKDGNCDGLPDMEEDFDFDGHPLCEDCDDKDPNVYPGAAPDCTGKIKDANCDGAPDIGSDQDKDGYSSCNDCDDGDPGVHLYALETCNGKDDDCNAVVDDLDYDGDGYPACKIANFKLDCNDKDLTVNPGALRNCKNGKDNDCSGVIDANEDGDGDGVVGCQDCNDYNKSINPKALESLGDNIDNNCNGKTDESPASCDVATLDTTKPADYAKSIGLCSGVVSATFPTAAAGNSHAIQKGFGVKNIPNGATFIVLSSGVAAAKGQPGYTGVSTAFSNSAPYPNVNCKNSSSVYDYTELKLVINVPANAKAFSFDFNFMSHEYPVYVGSGYNDKFLAVLDSTAFKGNVSFDSKGNCISINNALFQECDPNAPNKKSTCNLGPSGLAGTGYDDVGGGGTGWLTTTSPVTPGEQITLRFIVFDEGDHILDSVAIIDNFRWLAGSTSSTPSTIRPGS
ncbi:MAG: putative metal-binding motif-containing protein [Deltaproteobacteria bacterium]|nr:putative metal-binding motif-containing protein [Deltaproteobacteria bacterium]